MFPYVTNNLLVRPIYWLLVEITSKINEYSHYFVFLLNFNETISLLNSKTHVSLISKGHNKNRLLPNPIPKLIKMATLYEVTLKTDILTLAESFCHEYI